MKVLLINPPMNLKKSLGEYEKFMEPMPCVGLAYIVAVLRENNVEVSVLDGFAENSTLKEIKEKVEKEEPDILGISCLTPAANSTFKICEEIKKLDQNIFIVLGHRHAEVFAEDIVKKGLADAVIKGEGEYSMLELVKSLENNTELSKVKGIVFKRKGKLVDTGYREPIKDLDGLPYPAWDLFPYTEYGALPFTDIKKPLLGILASRGCPYNCTFCSSRKTKFRKRDPVKIGDEIEFLVEEYNAQQITFMDLIFPVNKKYGLEICNEIIKRGLNEKIIWATETRVDVVDEELFRKMKQAGCKRVMFGIESGSQKILNKIKKGITLNQVRNTVKTAKRVGLECVGFFMLGLPGENKELAEKTINFANEIPLDFAKFAIFIPFPGCEIFNNLVDKGILNLEKIKRQDWIKFSPYNPNPSSVIYCPDKITKKELLKLREKGHRKFYLNPKNIYNIIFKVRTISFKDLLKGGKIFFNEYFK